MFTVVRDFLRDAPGRLLRVDRLVSYSEYMKFTEAVEVMKREAARDLADCIIRHGDNFFTCEDMVSQSVFAVRADCYVLTGAELKDIITKTFIDGVEKGRFGK